MKKRIALLFALQLMLVSSALAVTQEEAVSLAADAVGGGAEVVRTERDDGVYQMDLRGDGARYEVDILGASGAVLQIETVYTDAGRANAYVLTDEEARAAAKAVAPEAEEGLVTAERDDGACVYEVFYSTGSAVGEVSVNAQTGAIVRVETYPAAQGVLSIDEVVRLVSERQPGAEIVELEMEWDDGGYQLDGEALVGGARYSFELDAVSGRFMEWERD